jgi:Cu(I)/Ag(I) efflux system membrane protein CusA/SilA
MNGTPILVKNIARVEIGPEMRRGIADLDGEGDTVGGIVVMRYGRERPECDRPRESQIGRSETVPSPRALRWSPPTTGRTSSTGPSPP